MLRRALNLRIGQTGLAPAYVGKLWAAALLGALVAWGVKLTLPPLHPAIVGAVVLLPYGLVFGAMTLALRVPEASSALRRVWRRSQ
jgi:putative peptidoglycan lipid II flippase